MEVLAILFLAIAAATAFPTGNVLSFREVLGLNPRIISGKPASKGQFPWQVSNLYDKPVGQGFCGGALITRRWVLTAAHCAISDYFIITAGAIHKDNTTETGVVHIETDTAIVHPDYEPINVLNDIALIDLKKEIGLTNNIKTIPLGDTFIPANTKLTISGWGKTSDSSNTVSPILMFVEITTITNEECKKDYAKAINNGSLCCVGAPEESTCSGDSGGPLVAYDKNGNAVHVGVASFVHKLGCASGKPSGYARTQFYRPWILKTIGN